MPVKKAKEDVYFLDDKLMHQCQPEKTAQK